MTPKIAHVFPFDPRHLAADRRTFLALLRERWPIAAIAESRLAEHSTMHFIGHRSEDLTFSPFDFACHRALTSGPRFRSWGDDWSWSLGHAIRQLGRDDVCVLHLNDYAAARYAHRAAARTRVVLVFHGRGLGRSDDHLLAADGYVALHEEARRDLIRLGVRPELITVMSPSVDRDIFFPAVGPLRGSTVGFIGRLEHAKGVLEVPRVLAAVPHVRAEVIGFGTPEQRRVLMATAEQLGVHGRLALLGELPPREVAKRLRDWRLLLMPSYSEGSPLVVGEAMAARVPVAAISHVLTPWHERHPGVHVSAREAYPVLVERLLALEERPPAMMDVVPSHVAAAAEWDSVIERLPQWEPRERVRVRRLGRMARLRQLQRLRSTVKVLGRRLLDRKGTRWLLAVGGSLLLTYRHRQLVLVTARGRWWVHRYGRTSLVYPGFAGTTPKELESQTLDTFCHEYIPSSGDIVVDLGAGIGEEALTFSALVGQEGRVVCVEAHPETFARLDATIKLNRLDNVEAANFAVADHAGSVQLSAGTGTNHVGNRLMPAADSITVPADSVDGLYEQFGLERVDLLKMNIEGAEALAIVCWSEALSRTLHVAISCHDFLLAYGAPPDLATFDLVKTAVERAGFAIEIRPDDPKPWNRYYIYGTRRDVHTAPSSSR